MSNLILLGIAALVTAINPFLGLIAWSIWIGDCLAPVKPKKVVKRPPPPPKIITAAQRQKNIRNCLDNPL